MEARQQQAAPGALVDVTDLVADYIGAHVMPSGDASDVIDAARLSFMDRTLERGFTLTHTQRTEFNEWHTRQLVAMHAKGISIGAGNGYLSFTFVPNAGGINITVENLLTRDKAFLTSY
jgi:hypothetical protein